MVWSCGWPASSSQLRPPCEAYAEAGIVQSAWRHSWYKAGHKSSLARPAALQGRYPSPSRYWSSVLSPTTCCIDFNRKLPDYQQIPSMRDVLLVSNMERLIGHWPGVNADGWTEHRHRRAATVRLSSRAGHRRNARAVRRSCARAATRAGRQKWPRPGGGESSAPGEDGADQAVKDRIYASKTIEKGLLIVHTRHRQGQEHGGLGAGDALPRARPQARRRAVRQGPAGHRRTPSARALSQQVTLKVMGRRLHLGDAGPGARRRRRAPPGMRPRSHAQDSELHMVVLDELNIVLRKDYLPLAEVIEACASSVPSCTCGCRPQRQARADRGGRPRHRDDAHQAPVPRGREGTAGRRRIPRAAPHVDRGRRSKVG